MKHYLYNFLLSTSIIALFSLNNIELTAKSPNAPMRVGASAQVSDSNSVKGLLTLRWFDWSNEDDPGDYYRISLTKNVMGDSTVILTDSVPRDNRSAISDYVYTVENMGVAEYCFTIDLYDSDKDVASTSVMRCTSVKDSIGDMKFINLDDVIHLDENGYAEYLIQVHNPTECEYTISNRYSNVNIIESIETNTGLLVKVQAKEKGMSAANYALYNKCENKYIEEIVIGFCYGECSEDYDTYGLFFYDPMMNRFPDAREGLEFKYDANAFADKPCTIEYSLEEDYHPIPEDMRIDEETGVLTWDYPIEGAQNVRIVAEAIGKNGKVEKKTHIITIMVHPGEPKYSSFLNCKFIDLKDKNKQFQGKVTVWNADTNNLDSAFSETLVVDGNEVRINLPADNYYLRADLTGYESQLYQGAYEVENAKTIEIAEGNTSNIEMTLNTLPVPDFVTVSGKVTNARTGEPVKSTVTFQSVKSVLGGKDPLDAYAESYHTVEAETDNSGNYTVELPDIFSFYGHAKASNIDDSYEVLYYENTSTYYEADIITTKADRNDVNFNLKKKESNNGALTGSVINETKKLLESTVIAIPVGDEGQKEVTRTDSGSYTFSELQYGKYVLLSLPNDDEYLPGYYIKDGVATQSWENATIIGIDEAMPAVQRDITHTKVEKGRAKGIARFDGKLVKKWKGMSPYGTAEDSDYISGAIVLLVNGEGSISDYSISNNNGDFLFNELPQGRYTLYVDKFGYEMYSNDFEISYSESFEYGSDIELTAKSPTSVDYDTFDGNGLTVSPMPVLDNSTVRFTGEAGTANIELISINGDVVFSESITTNAGENTYELKSNELVSGQYILVIRNGEMITAGKITVIK